MKQRFEAERLYKKSIFHGEDDSGHERKNIYFLIYQFLCVCGPKERFQLQEIVKIINDTAKAQIFSPIKAAKAFSNMEHYFTVLCKMPWKKEFHKLNIYGGFYQTNITSHLKSAEILFQLIGYKDTAEGIFLLSKPANVENLVEIAFECFIASVECKLIDDILSKLLTEQISIVEVVHVRFSHKGNPDDIAVMLNEKHGKSDNPPICQTQPQKQRVSHVDPGPVLVEGEKAFRDRLQEHMKVVQKHSTGSERDIPYMDDEDNLAEGTLDDHLMASLQIIQKDRPRPSEVKPAVRASQEWSFVNEELERRKKSGIEEQQLRERGMEFPSKLKRKYGTSQGPSHIGIPDLNTSSGSVRKNVSGPILRSNEIDGFSSQNENYRFPASQNATISTVPGRHSVNLPPYKHPPGYQSAFSAPIMARSADSDLSNYPNIVTHRKKASAPYIGREKWPPNYSAPVAAKFSEKGWRCMHCTYINADERLVCEICAKSKEATLETDSPMLGKTSKVCEQCTLNNENDNEKCVACGSDLKSIHTAV